MYMWLQKHTNYGMMLIAKINSGNNDNKKSVGVSFICQL